MHTIEEAEPLAALRLGTPILILGYVGRAEAARAVAAGAEVTVYNLETVVALSAAASAGGKERPLPRQDRDGSLSARDPSRRTSTPSSTVSSLCPGLELAGVSTHFANIEDTTDHSYARRQLEIFSRRRARARTRPAGDPPLRLRGGGPDDA